MFWTEWKWKRIKLYGIQLIRHWDKFITPNTHINKEKNSLCYIYYCISCVVDFIHGRREFRLEPYTCDNLRIFKLASGAVHFKPCFSSTTHILPVPSAKRHVPATFSSSSLRHCLGAGTVDDWRIPKGITTCSSDLVPRCTGSSHFLIPAWARFHLWPNHLEIVHPWDLADPFLQERHAVLSHSPT